MKNPTIKDLKGDALLMAVVVRNSLAQKLLLQLASSATIGVPSLSDIKDCYRCADEFVALGIESAESLGLAASDASVASFTPSSSVQ